MHTSEQYKTHLSHSLAVNLYELYFTLRNQSAQFLLPYHLSPEQWHIIYIIHYAKIPLTQKDLCQIMKREKHTISKMITKLVNNQWLERNGRQVLVKKDKVELVPVLKESINNFFTQLIPQQQHDQLLQACKNMLETLSSHADPNPSPP